MASSVKMISTVNSEKSVLLTHEQGWKNTKIYAQGKVVKSYSDAKELKQGVHEEIEGLGSIKFQLHPATLTPSLFINGEKYVREKIKKERPKEIIGLFVVFGILAFANLLFLLLATLRYYEASWEVERQFSTFVIVIASAFLCIYTCSVIFLARGIYFFYFLGTGFFIISTLYVCFINAQSINTLTLIIIVPRFIILIILGTYFKRMLGYMRAPSKEVEIDVLDSDF